VKDINRNRAAIPEFGAVREGRRVKTYPNTKRSNIGLPHGLAAVLIIYHL
jgi:hypothetical protein